jgi:hypothetical protein
VHATCAPEPEWFAPSERWCPASLLIIYRAATAEPTIIADLAEHAATTLITQQ